MKDHIRAVTAGEPYKAPERAIDHTVEGLVHCALVTRESEHGALLTPEVRALDAIGTRVERELKNRADMIHDLNDRLATAHAELRELREHGYVTSQNTRTILDDEPREIVQTHLGAVTG